MKSFKLDLKKLFFKPQAPEPEAKLIVPAKDQFLLKKLKWVVHEGQVAIVYEIDLGGFATLHYVDADGFTVREGRASFGSLRLAKYAEIPAPRRVGLSPQYAATLGYF